MNQHHYHYHPPQSQPPQRQQRSIFSIVIAMYLLYLLFTGAFSGITDLFTHTVMEAAGYATVEGEAPQFVGVIGVLLTLVILFCSVFGKGFILLIAIWLIYKTGLITWFIDCLVQMGEFVAVSVGFLKDKAEKSEVAATRAEDMMLAAVKSTREKVADIGDEVSQLRAQIAQLRVKYMSDTAGANVAPLDTPKPPTDVQVDVDQIS